ncbi:MAG: hypothetical protein KatS3mg120_1044 [Erythrobacter sp.]|nr:MAG: hypothetical protein KatS3mg120_1044 [Erythrobacter sp.]
MPTRRAIRCSTRCAPGARRARAEHGIPAYLIFPDSVLRAIAQTRPQSLADLARIPGIGAKKLETWGADFLDVVRAARGWLALLLAQAVVDAHAHPGAELLASADSRRTHAAPEDERALVGAHPVISR